MMFSQLAVGILLAHSLVKHKRPVKRTGFRDAWSELPRAARRSAI
jgi:hypothetical protein